MGLLSWLKEGTFSHGVHPSYHKAETQSKAIRRLPFPSQLIVPLSQHIGAPAKAIVTPGQEVFRGQVIAEANGFVSVPIHAPATGRVKDICLMPSAKGPHQMSIIIDVYRADTQEVMYGLEQDMEKMPRENISKAIQATGMAGLGGAAFPTHVKLQENKDYDIHTLVVNGCECEPYLTTDHRVMVEQPEDLLRGIRYALRATGAEKAIIGIEDNKADAAKILQEKIHDDDPISVKLVRTKYPQGAEKMLLKSLLNVEVPRGGLPAQVGVVVDNVGTLAQLGYLLPRGEGLIERVITITGTAVKNPGNYTVPFGTTIRFVLEALDIDVDHDKIILGGPMMGASVASLDVPITKGTSGILVFHEREAICDNEHPQYPCIKCARCVQACPMHLNPAHLGWLAENREYAEMADNFNLRDCFECGCCSFVCPSNIPLVQHFRVAKAYNLKNPQEVA